MMLYFKNLALVIHLRPFITNHSLWEWVFLNNIIMEKNRLSGLNFQQISSSNKTVSSFNVVLFVLWQEIRMVRLLELKPRQSRGRRSLVGCCPWGRWESDTTERLHFHALEKEMATHSSVLAWRIPGTGEPGGLLSMGSHRVGHD